MSATKGNGKTIQWLRDHVDYNADYCLIWPYNRNPNGYGQLGYLGETLYAHRTMCEMAHGPAPSPDHEAAHSCGNGHGGCASPKHLSWKTKTGNLLDCREHGTQARSYHGSKGKLTEAQVAEIRTLRGRMTQSEIAIRFGVSDPTVRDILLGRTHTAPSKIKYYTPEDDAKMRDAIKQGCNFTQIAKLLGRPVHAVSGRAYRLGLKSGQPVQKTMP
jgi:DNA-binding CsgD family transcriptional regulator